VKLKKVISNSSNCSFQLQKSDIDEEPEIDSIATFIRAQEFAKNHDVDLSDELQLLSVRHGKFCKLAKESKTLLTTSDKELANSAKTEGLRVWNCEKKLKPPDE
jgi:hypothetical protein